MSNYLNKIKRVLTNYDLGSLKKYTLVKGGFVNTNYKVITTKGTFFLRHFKQIKDISKIIDVNNFLLELKKRNFPVAKPFFTKNNYSVIELDGNFFSIYEFIQGEEYNFSNNHFYNAAKTLALFHKNVKDISIKKPALVDIYKDNILKTLVIGENSLLQKLKKKKRKTNLESYLIKALERVEEHSILYKKELNSLEKRNDFSIIHGDYWFGQLIFQDNKVAALIDFDEVKIGLTGYDLVRGVRSFPRYLDKIDYNLDKLSDFLKIYKKFYDEVEFKDGEPIVFLKHALLDILKFHIYTQAYTNKDEEAIGIINYHLDELDWIIKNEKKILETFSCFTMNN